MLIHCYSYARAGLLGNPSDGYFGKTIAVAMANFPAVVTIYESPEIHLSQNVEDRGDFNSLEDMVKEIERFGYYGGIRLVKATSREFFKYCIDNGITIPKRNFTLRYKTTVPQLVGLGGSSAICTATIKALQKFYEIEIPKHIAATLCWKAECDLSIKCGLQDRVIQMYNGLVYMDFNKKFFDEHRYGIYEELDVSTLPKFYLAYDPERAEFSGTYHQKLNDLYSDRKREIAAAMSEFADFASQGKEALAKGDVAELNRLINANFDLRNKVLTVSDKNERMVMTARKSGASAKFAGSGGAIIGLYEDEAMFKRLKADLEAIGCAVLAPTVALPE